MTWASAAWAALGYSAPARELTEGGGEQPSLPVVLPGRIHRALLGMRRRVMPLVMASANGTSTKVTLLRRQLVADTLDPLNVRAVIAGEQVNGVMTGPSANNLESGLMATQDHEVLLAAQDLASPPTVQDGVQVNGVTYDVVGVQPFPAAPVVVAYKLMLKRAA